MRVTLRFPRRCATPLTLMFALLACNGVPPEQSLGNASAFTLADSLRDLERYGEALPHYLHLRDSLAAAGDTSGWWKAELWWSYGQMRLGHLDSAEAGLARARPLARTDADRNAWTHVVTSNLLSLRGQFDSAVVEAEHGRDLARPTHDENLIHAVAYALGWVYSSTGRAHDAFEVDSQSVARRRAHGGKPRLALASALNALGIDYYWMGRETDAMAALEEALAIYRPIGQLQGATRVLVTLGHLHSRNSDDRRALETYTEALSYAQRVGEGTNEVAILHNNIALLLLVSGSFPGARQHLQHALRISRSTSQPYAEILALYNLGRIETLIDQPSKATALYRAALAMADSLGYAMIATGIRTDLAMNAADLGDTRAALRWGREGLAAADSIGTPTVQVPALDGMGFALERAGRPSEAGEQYLKALGMIESWRGRVAIGNLRMGPTYSAMNLYERAVHLFFAQGQHHKAFEIAERARARVLLDIVADRQDGAPPRTRSDSLQEELRSKLAARGSASPDSQAPLDRDIRQIGLALTALEAESRRQDPVAGAALFPAPARLAEIRNHLVGPDRNLLAYFWGKQDVYGWWLSSDSIHAARLGSADSLAALLDFLRGTIDNPARDSSWMVPARRAYQQLVAPLRPTDAGEVLVITDGPLTRIPLETFLPPGEAKPWGAVRQFSYGPSASVLLALAQAPLQRRWEHTLLAVGNPEVGPGRVADSLRSAREVDPGPLPYAAVEAKAIHALFREDGADLIVGREATIQRLLELDPSRYRYLHFAAHARIDDQRPERTHFLLAQGVLGLARIRALRLHADLVTLSGCETALGRQVGGEGILGLPHAFLAAGARGVVVTLWRVADRSTAEFMTEFYRELRAGNSPADALLRVRRRWISSGNARTHPFRWASFIVVGGLQATSSANGPSGEQPVSADVK